MNIFKKILSFVLSIFVFAAAFTFAGASSSKVSAEEIPPVQLYYSHEVQESRDVGHYEGYIAVKNIAYDKKVTVHYQYNDDAWKDVEANYVKTDAVDGYEIWKFSTPSTLGYWEMQFAIKYEVNGQTYWDNNNGQNYKENDFNASRPHVTDYSEYYENYTNILNIGIETKKSVNPEAVKIRYSEDNWATYKDVDAANIVSYNNDVNFWEVRLPISSTKQVKFAAYYVINGSKYWDNNMGDNYTYTMK